MIEINLILPIAGRGSRFSARGIDTPKPLIDLFGKPFFWWATESAKRVFKVKQLIFVVLEEHRVKFDIDKVIHRYYPEAEVIAIPEVTSGAAETAAIGVQAVLNDLPIAINDCDHAFLAEAVLSADQLSAGNWGALMCFKSSNPAYSYAMLSDNNTVSGTVEKKVVSDYAIAGCYYFSSRQYFFELYEPYKQNCGYNELFISGLYNLAVDRAEYVFKIDLLQHATFGTPDEFDAVSQENFSAFLAWVD